jgi:hypothetical protein
MHKTLKLSMEPKRGADGGIQIEFEFPTPNSLSHMYIKKNRK